MNLEDRIAADGITAAFTRRDRAPGWATDTERSHDDWWDVTLSYGGAELRTPFSTGPGWTHEPGVADVIRALSDDAHTYFSADGFEDWAADMGWDAYEPGEGGRARTRYKLVGEMAERFRAWLGEEQYEAYLYETGR